MGFKDELLRRGREYTERRGLTLTDELGTGVQGSVFLTESHAEKREASACSAIKVLQRESDYRRERDVYLRLTEHGVSAVRGCEVPRLLHWDDELWIIEMTVVTRPFVLDFAGAYLDWGPEFSEEVLADWLADKQEQFGSRWPAVEAILRELEGYGVFVIDVTPNNIALDV